MKKMVFYSQNREDLYIKAFFPEIKKGFYIDIGAFDPVYHSVTKLFYDEGWEGINVEPQHSYIKKLKQARRRDINLQVGVSDKKGKLALREYKGGGLSTFSQKMKAEYEQDSAMNKVKYRDYSVEVITLNDVFKYVPSSKKVNFLKVDVEGLEYEVFKGNDWAKNRPELICVEANHIENDWKSLLVKNGYNKVFFDGLNEYYLSKESSQRWSLFDFPKMFLRGSEIVPHRLDWQLIRLKKELSYSYKRIAVLEKEINQLHDETRELYKDKQILNEKILDLNRKVERLETIKHSIRHNSKQLIRNVGRRIKSLRSGR